MATVPPGGAQIGHQGAPLECQRPQNAQISTDFYSIWVILQLRKIVIFVVYATLCSLAAQPHKISREFILLGGHYDLQTASEVRSALRFEISDLNYLHIHVHIAYIV